MLTDYHLHLRPDEDDTPPSATSPPRTSTATSPPPTAAGIEELGRLRARLPLPPGARPLAPPVLGGAGARRPRRLLRVRPRHAAAGSGIECDFVPGAEDRTATLLEARDFDYVVGSVHFVGERRASTTTGWDVWEGERRPRRGLAPLLRGARRVRPLRPLRHPRPPRPGQGLGRRPAAARARPAPLLRARGRGDRRERDRGRGLDRRACASRSASSTRRAASPRCASRPAPPSRSPPTPTCPSRSASATSRAVEFLDELGVGEICVFERRRRRLEPLGSRVG